MLRIYLARHGQDRDNVRGILNGHRDEPLTGLGRKQAKETAEKIKSLGIKLDKVYASPLKRTFDTAKIITDYLGLPRPEKWDLLIERDFGILTGKTHTDIPILCSEVLWSQADGFYYMLQAKGLETFRVVYKRAKLLLNKLMKNHSDGNILMVTSGDIGKMIYAAYYGLDWEETLKMFHFGNSDLLVMAPDSPATDSHVIQIKQHNL